MTPPFNRSCSTSSTPPSPDGRRGVVSRRGLLKLSAACAAVLVPGNAAWAASPAAARSAAATAAQSPPSHLTYESDSIEVVVDVRQTQDVDVLHYTITNRTDTTDVYTLSYIDGKTNRESKPQNLTLDGGMSGAVDFYGGLNRSFTIKVCPASTAPDCLMLGPVASPTTAAAVKAVGIKSLRR